MFRKFALLTIAALVCVGASSASTVETELLRKIVRYETEKAAALTELAEIQKIIATMNTQATTTTATAAGSSSGATSENVVAPSTGSGSGDNYAIETPPVVTSAPPAKTPAAAGSVASDAATVATTAPTTAPAAKSASAVTHVAPVAVGIVAAAIALL